MNAREVTQFVKAFGVFGCFDNEWQWHGEMALVRVGEETLRCSLPELFGRSVARRVAAAGRAIGREVLPGDTALALAVLALHDATVYRRFGPVADKLVKIVGGNGRPSRSRKAKVARDSAAPPYREVLDWYNRKLVVWTPQPGRWVGWGGNRIREMRTMLAGIGWNIEVLPLIHPRWLTREVAKWSFSAKNTPHQGSSAGRSGPAGAE